MQCGVARLAGGGASFLHEHVAEEVDEWYGGGRTNMVIAGNYFGMAVDGITRFTNSMKLFGGFNSSTTVRIGSDFDGVSDDIEGNVIDGLHPAAVKTLADMREGDQGCILHSVDLLPDLGSV